MLYIHKTFNHPRFGKAFHLMADTREELLIAARKIGLNPSWIQKPGTPYEHFDIMGKNIPKALEIATRIDDREVVSLIRRKRDKKTN